MKTLMILVFCSMVAGCAASFDNRADNIYQLSERNVVRRDLTQPESIYNPATSVRFEPLRLNP